MKELPILFSTPMVQAILEGRKTQTRRIVKRTALDWLNSGFTPEYICDPGNASLCPYGQPGDLLWVRETWRPWSWNPDSGECGIQFKDGQIKDIDSDDDEWFQNLWEKVSDELHEKGFKPENTDEDEYAIFPPESQEALRWHPSIHMPKAAARIWLQVESVGVERLQEISEEDAIAEGVVFKAEEINGGIAYIDTGAEAYQILWQSINGPGSWEANPFVWVVKFKTLSVTGRPVSGTQETK